MSTNFSNYLTFQTLFPLPIPPPPPPPTINPELPQELPQEMKDQQYISSFETKVQVPKRRLRIKCENICRTKYRLAGLVSAFRDIKNQEKLLAGNHHISDDEWKSAIESIKINKFVIDHTIKRVTGTFIELSRKVLTKRASKRRRIRRRREDYREDRKKFFKAREENSRKIDENMQKIKEAMQRAKEQEEAKREADVILKEVLKKKHDAKKSIAKLEALLKLRQARQNTAKGTGQNVPEQEMVSFQENIERLKSLWICKLSAYEEEESQLRAKLDLNKPEEEPTEIEREVLGNLAKWRKVMFGSDTNPQVDFNGDVDKFIAVRSLWDQFIAKGPESSAIPIGWVLPAQA